MADQEGDKKPEDQVQASEDKADANVDGEESKPVEDENLGEVAGEGKEAGEEVSEEQKDAAKEAAGESKEAEPESQVAEKGGENDNTAPVTEEPQETEEKVDTELKEESPEEKKDTEQKEAFAEEKTDAEPKEESAEVKTDEEPKEESAEEKKDTEVKEEPAEEKTDIEPKEESPEEKNDAEVKEEPAEEKTDIEPKEESLEEKNDTEVKEEPAEEKTEAEPKEETLEETKDKEAKEQSLEDTINTEPKEEAPVDSDETNNAEQLEGEGETDPDKTVEEDKPELDQAEEVKEEKSVEPVQVGADVSEPPPGSPKVAMEDKKPNIQLDATATVKFVLMPSGQVVTLACTLGQTLSSLKAHFAAELKMPNNVIMLMFDGKSMPDGTLLADLGVGPNGTIQLEMQSADPVNTPIKPYRPRQEYHMPDVITVRVTTEDCEVKDVVVEIERSRCKKPYLGGFRNKNTGLEFHNASAQTMKKPRPPPTVERFCRDTQTCEQKSMRQQTTNTTSTQMTGVGVYVSNMEDTLLVPGKYFTADEHLARILRHVIILQKYYRRWLAKRYVTKLKEDKARRQEWERKEELRKKKEKEERIKKDYARRLNPKTKADFDMLLHCLEKWRQEEMERINSTLVGAERKAALCMLLDQETELLSAIERHKNEAYDDNRDKRIMAFLEKAAAPKKWQGHDGKLTYMDTPFTIRAKELRDIFNSINMKYLTQDERLDVLLTLKHTVKEHDCKLTQEIIELIDREADLLMRGVKEGNLTGLRKRISTLFLQYIKTPTFNPEAARLLKVPQDPSTLRKNINYCHSCGNYLPSTEFFITSNSKHVGRCRKCMKIENDGRQREDHTFYRVMLKALRKSEEAMQDGSSICFLLQEHDLRYLVENIWSNQSVLSAWDDLYDLVLVRWDKHQEWSPWNCILLTHDEAEAHKKLFSLEEGYGHVFIHKVTQKHNFGRNYFSRLPGMAELLRQKLGNRDLAPNNGPSVSGQPIPKAQKV